uniref:Uncharacterized protein n=1 Tax=Acrobeloides nanus TaxID=290746 RepID=A0A914DTT3_9BILA
MSISVVNDPNLPNELYELLLRKIIPSTPSSMLTYYIPKVSRRTFDESTPNLPSISKRTSERISATVNMVDSAIWSIFGQNRL